MELTKCGITLYILHAQYIKYFLEISDIIQHGLSRTLTKRWQILTDAVYNAVIVALNMVEEIHNIINNRIFTLHVFVPASDLGNLLVLEYWKSVLGTHFMACVSSQ